MSKVKLYIACSIDGYIARADGSVDWLNDFDPPQGHDYGYTDFYNSVGMVLMGRRTYEEVLGFGVDWPYSDKLSLIASSNQAFQPTTPSTELVTDMTPAGIAKLKKHSEGDIWLVGGGVLVARFLEDHSIDEMIICTIPILLGTGVPLFIGVDIEARFELIDSTAYENGAVLNHYVNAHHLRN